MRAVVMGIYSIFQSKAAVCIQTVKERILKHQRSENMHRNLQVLPLCVRPIFVWLDCRSINTTAAAEDRFSQLQRKMNSLECPVRKIFTTYSPPALHLQSLAIQVKSHRYMYRVDNGLICSYNPDIKKAITCLLMGGSKKILPDGMRLRGDISVLLLGDPGTAKSQLLKFVEKVAPIAVYTSGKGSSAAGLTASVIRDPSSVSIHNIMYDYACLYLRFAERFLFGGRCHGPG